MNPTPELLARAERACVVAPAGYGKTHTIAQAVACCGTGRQLVLTHTNAGVHSLEQKLKSLRVPAKSYEVETIAGWTFRLTQYFPRLSGAGDFQPESGEWSVIYAATVNLLHNSNLQKIIRATYAGVFVDEYQDCCIRQHALIMALAELLPCRVLGDPLQAIFQFDNNRLKNWEQEVYPHFPRLPDLDIPLRWRMRGDAQLGERLRQIREQIETGQSVRLDRPPIQWIPVDVSNFMQPAQICRRLTSSQGSIAVIHGVTVQNKCVNLARFLNGQYGVLEKIECDELFRAAAEIERCQGYDRVIRAVEFAFECITNVKRELDTQLRQWKKGKEANLNANTKYSELTAALNRVGADNSLESLCKAMPLLEGLSNCFMYRKELWFEMKRTLKEYSRGGYGSLSETARYIRYRTREIGRKIDHRTVSRTLLVKGLEFDHVLVVNAHDLDNKQNLYVALTRGCRSLTVISSSPEIEIPN